jgi:ubiquitin-activating enzyme E1
MHADAARSRGRHGTKRTPSALQFSVDDELHLGFVAAAANLHAQVYGLKGSEDAAFFRASLAALPAQDPSSTVAAPPAADADAASAEADAVAACEQALAALPSPSSLAGFRLATLQYDADDASHGDFAAAAAALRAVCYRIPAPDALVARLSAGGVPGALQPAAALAGGLLALEVCKLAAQPCPPLHAFRCRYASLASAQLLSAQPAAVCTARVVGAGGRVLDWSLWDRIDIDARGLTLADALARLQEQLGVRPSMLSHGKCLLYADFIAPAKRAERLAMGIQQLVETVGKAALPASCKHLICSVSASDEQDEDVEVPDVRFLV